VTLKMSINEPSAVGHDDARNDFVRARLATIVDSSDDAIVSKTLDGIITSWNRAAEQLFGYSAAEAIGQHIFLIVPDDRRDEEIEVLARLRQGERVDHFETVRQTKDGRRIPILLTVSPIRDSDGRIVGASKVARDISERQQSEQLRARLAAIVDSSDDAIVGETLDGVITSWNRAAERLFGYSAAEAIGQHIFMIIPPDRRQEEIEVLARIRRGEKIDHFETRRQAKDGRHVSVSLTVSPIREAQGLIVGASKIARDITERARAQEELRRAHEELEERVRRRTAELMEANESLRSEIEQRQIVEQQRAQLFNRLILAQEDERRRIARELHDQLGQQMTALRLTLETLKNLSSESSPVRRQVEALQELARQLDRDIAFRVWELRPAMLEELGLTAALTEYAGNWSTRFGIRAELHMTRPLDGRLPPQIETTIYRLAQEALNNVVKHARANRVDIILEHTHEHVSLIVEDDGVGFDPSAAETTVEGFGIIGMRERAALAGADFQIESAPGDGTTVILRVPATSASVARST
jgi:PAS domain S-box-containing protein